MDKSIQLIKKAEYGHELDENEIVYLLKNDKCNSILFKAADSVRKKYVGDSIHLRGLIEFSNICKRNCMYCGLRYDNGNIKRYRLSPDDIIELAQRAKRYGYKTIVMQSGEDDYYTVDIFKYIISNIKKMDMALTLSVGEKSFQEYKEFRKAGADRYLMRIETTDEKLYGKMHPGMSYKNRKRCLKDLKNLGYEVGTGCLIGLPNQSVESLAEDILFFKEIDADMIGLGPFIPSDNTPLKDEIGGNLIISMKVMAIIRLLMPDINIPATTAMESLAVDGRTRALQSGANVVMPNVTEGIYRKLYAIYPGKICTGDTPSHCRNCITQKISDIGRTVSDSKGFRIKANNLQN